MISECKGESVAHGFRVLSNDKGCESGTISNAGRQTEDLKRSSSEDTST